jgi:hypothetical protein
LHQDYRAVPSAKLCRKIVGDHLKFFNGRERGPLAVLILGRIVVVYAIDLKRRAARPGAIEVNR